MGGEEAFAGKLDSLFTVSSELEGETVSADISGLIGQYAHGNEPSHHIIHLYNYVNRPWRTQELVDSVLHSQYRNAPDGLSGNEDCGQMSAWYIFSALGFYPVNPVSLEYVMGAPQIPRAQIKLKNGKVFTMIAHDLSKENKYVKSVQLNGRQIRDYKISYDDIMQGGTLEFLMTNER